MGPLLQESFFITVLRSIYSKLIVVTSWHGKILSISWPFASGTTGFTCGIPYKTVNNQRQGFGVFFYCWRLEQIVEQTTELLMIWDAHVTLL